MPSPRRFLTIQVIPVICKPPSFSWSILFSHWRKDSLGRTEAGRGTRGNDLGMRESERDLLHWKRYIHAASHASSNPSLVLASLSAHVSPPEDENIQAYAQHTIRTNASNQRKQAST